MRTRRKPKLVPVSSPTLTLIVILSALLFVTLLFVSCKNEMNGPPPPKVADRNILSSAPPPPPMSRPPTEMRKEAVAGGIAGAVVGGVAGGVVGGVVGAAAEDVAHNTEEYGRFQENPFLSVVDNPLSTFSIDVDRASYSNVRRYLNAGQRPPRDAVRIEELINYFTFDYPHPHGADPFSLTTETASCPWHAKHGLLPAGLQP